MERREPVYCLELIGAGGLDVIVINSQVGAEIHLLELQALDFMAFHLTLHGC